jgi:hypothetical protein
MAPRRALGSLARFLSDGPICLSNNAAECALRGIGPRAEVVAVRRIGSRWPACRRNVFTHDHRQAQSHRSSCLARRRARQDRRSARSGRPRAARHRTATLTTIALYDSISRWFDADV